ncbi:MAG TPA: FliM/FliN family flagellar motor switch protein [Acidobacteriaceae bacterium]|nr:FliM/FliN family flagellar motor switch protein [Acidobacteriaceae bacterium]
MANNRRVFELWFEIMRAELEELVHVPVTSRTVSEIPSAASAYRSQLLLEGPVHGVMYVTASAPSLVQLSQMVAGEPVDPRAAWTEEGLEVWLVWLTAASGKLATQLSVEIGDVSKSACTILLQGTTAVDGMDSASGADTTASGAAIQEWILQAAETEFALSVSAQVMFPDDDAAAADADQPVPESASRALENAVPESDKVSPEPIQTIAQASPSLDQESETSPPKAAAAPREDPQTAQPVENQSPVDPPKAARKVEAAPAQDANPYTEPRTKQRLDLLLDIELEATLRFGALELPLREVLELGPGDVLPLDRHVREPVELVVGDRIVAKGEVVLVGGNFALHVTEVAEPRRRLETIRCLF